VITHAQLDHPNIIHLLGVFYDGPEAPPMMVLPLAEQGALADLIVTKVIKGIEYAWIVCSTFQLAERCPHPTSREGHWNWSRSGISSLAKASNLSWRYSSGKVASHTSEVSSKLKLRQGKLAD
jgi:hypothetical protein